MRRFNIAPRQACAHCQQWHWPPWGKVCMCVWGLAGWVSGSRQERIFPTAVAIYLRLGPLGRSDTNGITLTVGRRVRRGVCGKKKRGRGGRAKDLWGEKVYLEGINPAEGSKNGEQRSWEMKIDTGEEVVTVVSEWWREWEKREKEAADLNMQTGWRVWLERSDK